MKKLSFRVKITLWFSFITAFIIAVTFGVIFRVSNAVTQKNIQDNLIEITEANTDEIKYKDTIDDTWEMQDDQYIKYGDGYLEIDDDFLDIVNGIYSALYYETGTLLYGENPLAKINADIPFSDNTVQTVNFEGTEYYVFDRPISGDGTDGLWLRGIVSENQGTQQLDRIVSLSSVALPALLILAVLGGYWIAGRALKPVYKITEAATKISQGNDLNKHIESGKGTDELHRLVDVLNDMISRLNKAFKKEQQFTSDVSHELRTPMSVITAQCEYTLESTRTQEEYEDALRVIQRQGRKMSRLIDDMLCFARLDGHKDSYPKEKINLSMLVTDICDDMSLLKTNNIVLSRDIQPDIYIFGNSMLISRMITNLISNAYRYGKKDGKIFVKLSCSDEVLLSVEDNGIGIPAELHEKIFERFYRADESRSTEGTGLGLAMVKDIAAYHGGSVEVNSENKKGSTFFVHIPK